MPDCMQCPACQGKGEVPLPRPLVETLTYLRENGPSSVLDVHRGLKHKPRL